jgi:hypothetical protein
MPSKCKFQGCPNDPNYNFPGETKRLYCKEHIQPGMVNVKKDTRMCIHTDHTTPVRASYNLPGEKRPIYCKQHSQPGMVRLNSSNCDVCKLVSPSFGFPGQKAIRCKKCKENGMVDLVSNLCDTGCGANASFGLPGQKATRCKKCKEKDMTDVKNATCDLCDRQPTFGINNKATRCSEHILEGMADCKHMNVMCKECNVVRATYGIEKIPTHCAKHKTEEMKDLVSKMCVKCKETQGVFGII